MAAIQKIKATVYAIGKRMQGYHLLKNPKGTPQTEVNMLKTKTAISHHYDDMFEYEKITKNFSENNAKETRKSLYSTHYFDVDKKEMMKPKKKEISLIVEGTDEKTTYALREDLSSKVAESRKTPEFSYNRSSFLIHDSEYDKITQQKMREDNQRKYYKQKYTLSQKILSLGMHKKMTYPQENRPNFFKVLYENLTSK